MIYCRSCSRLQKLVKRWACRFCGWKVSDAKPRQHPLLLETVIKYQSNYRELLPANNTSKQYVKKHYVTKIVGPIKTR